MRTRLLTSVLVGLTAPLATLAAPLGTAFTYQGQIKAAGVPIDAPADMTFKLYDAVVGGNLLGTQVVNNVAITNGLFTVELNAAGQLGGNAFDGDKRWVEISVNGDALSPRQPLTAAPYALFSAAPWRTSAGGVSYTGGDVGIGTDTPTSPLHVVGADSDGVNAPFRITVNSGFPLGGTSLLLDNNEMDTTPSLIGPSALFINSHSQGDVILATGGGNTGVGTTTPENTLHVFKGSAGNVTGHANAPLVVENSANVYINLLTPDANERGILFGEASSNVAGAIIYNAGANPDGLQFRTNGNVTRMVLNSAGNLDVAGDVLVGAANLQASAGIERLRIIRGNVNADGSIAAGSGFAVTVGPNGGDYTMTFSTSFAAVPSVTVTSRSANRPIPRTPPEPAARSPRSD